MMPSMLKPLDFFIVCAGSRNRPLIERLSANPRLRIIPHFDEREASFFALGLAKKLQRPVAVVCTSGTAVSECFSAVIEAHYSGTPLVIISADRPKRFRGSGAPQTIEQSAIFGSYVQDAIDIDDDSFDIESLSVPGNRPSHINICIEESSEKNTLSKVSTSQKHSAASLPSFLSDKKQPIVILGELPLQDQKTVESFLLQLGAPVYAEASSGLRESKQLEKLLLKGSDRVVKKLLELGIVDALVRIGSVPTLRVWRDLETLGTPVFSIDAKPFSGMPHGHILQTNISEYLTSLTIEHRYQIHETVQHIDSRGARELARLLYEYPRSEPALVYSLSHLIHSNDSVFLGNSLPIREWDLAASHKTPHPMITVQRGTNGIDGQLSHFFGNLDGNRHNWGIFGDLTTLYGLNAFWILKEFPSVPVAVIVINNAGGDIFRRLPQLKQSFKTNPRLETLITNEHHKRFEAVAALWDLRYEQVEYFDKPLRTLGKSLIEVIPDPKQTNLFWDTWNMFWDSLR